MYVNVCSIFKAEIASGQSLDSIANTLRDKHKGRKHVVVILYTSMDDSIYLRGKNSTSSLSRPIDIDLIRHSFYDQSQRATKCIYYKGLESAKQDRNHNGFCSSSRWRFAKQLAHLKFITYI